MNLSRARAFWSRLHALELLAGPPDICPHGFAVQNDTDSLEAFTPGAGAGEEEEEKEVICERCGLPKQVIRLVHAPPEAWRRREE